MRAKKTPLANEHKGRNSTKSGRAFRVQIYGKFRTYTNKNAYILGVKS